MITHVLSPKISIKKSNKILVGSKMAILAFVASNFIEYNIFNIGNYPISIQKILVLVIFPISLMMMKKILINYKLLFFLFLILFAYSIKHIIFFNNFYILLLILGIILTGFLGSIVLYNALLKNNSFDFLAKSWIFFSVLTSIITFLQVLGFFSFFQNLEVVYGFNGLYRGVGLKTDPNFQSFILVIGLIFTQYYIKKHHFTTFCHAASLYEIKLCKQSFKFL